MGFIWNYMDIELICFDEVGVQLSMVDGDLMVMTN